MTQFDRTDDRGTKTITSAADVIIEADTDQNGAGDFIVRTGLVERARITAAGVASGLFGGGGSQTLSQILGSSTDAGSHKITNLVDPASAQDAATRNYVDTATSAIHGITYLVAASNAPAFIKARATYLCDGVDDDVQIQAAIDAAFADGGGLVVLSPGLFTGGQVAVKLYVGVDGYGMHATRYAAKNGLNTDVFIEYVSPDSIAANGEFGRVTNLMIDGNKANQSGGAGIHLAPSPSATKATNDPDFDPHFQIENVMLYNCKGDGFVATSRSETRLHNVYAYLCNGHSFNSSYDTFYTTCTSAWSGTDGFYTTSSSVRYGVCKSFYSGQVTPTSGNGFTAKSIHGIMYSACEAQDNQNSGWLLDTSYGCILGACSADSNSTRLAGAAPAVDIWDGGNHTVDVSCRERQADGVNSYQTHALRIRTNSTGSQIRLSHKAVGSATIGVAIDTGSDSVAGNDISINGMGSTTVPVFAASYTPDPYVATYHRVGNLTANITINAPTNAHIGSPLTVILRQDAVGGRTITWNATFLNTPTSVTAVNGFTIGRFIYDGTNWIGG